MVVVVVVVVVEDEVETGFVQSNQALPLSEGHEPEWGGYPVELPTALEVVAALTGTDVVVVVVVVVDDEVETGLVQSSQALPLSEGHDTGRVGYLIELLNAVDVVAALTGKDVVVVVVEDVVEEVDAGLVQSNHALPLSEGHETGRVGYFIELLDVVDVVAASTGKDVVVVVVEVVVEVEAGLVQSNHALPLSEGHDPECAGYFDELLGTVDDVGIVDVVAALTGKEVVVVEVEAALVQSSQPLPLSAGHDPE